MKKQRFLTLSNVLAIYQNQVSLYGGEYGIRDLNLLSSAIAMPEMAYGGQYLHKDLLHMAAAYAYHICQNHPFLDGNKRTALASALVFLDLNSVVVTDQKIRLYEGMMEIAKSKWNKEDFYHLLQELVVPA